MTLTRLNPDIIGKNIYMDEEKFIVKNQYLKGISFMQDSEDDLEQFNDDFLKKQNIMFNTKKIIHY